MQQKKLTKLLRLSYYIHYRKGKENLTVDALSRRLAIAEINESNRMDGIQQRSLNAIIAIVPTWYKEVQETYKNDLLCKKILVEKLVNPYSWPQYALLE